MCGNNITGAASNITLRMMHNDTGQQFNCTGILEEGNGTYNCTFNTSGMPAKFYHINMFSNRSYYNPDNDTANLAFFIDTAPVLSGWSLMPSGDGGWGEEYTFMVNVSDEDGDIMEVCAYANKSNTWGSAGCNLTVAGINQTVIFIKASDTYFHSGDIGPAEYKFNVTDSGNNPYVGGSQYSDQTPVTPFTVAGDDVFINVTLGNNSVVNRTSPDFLWEVKMYDTDLEPDEEVYAGTEGMFYYTKNISSGLWYQSEVKTTSGGASAGIIRFRDEDPEAEFYDCSFVIGPQMWKAGLITSDIYKPINSSVANWSMITTNITAVQLDPDGISRVRGVDSIVFRANVTDDCGALAGATVTFNVLQQGSEAVKEACSGTLYQGNGIYNCTMTAGTHSSWNTGWYNATTVAGKTYYNGTTYKKNSSFYLATVPVIGSTAAQAASGSSGGWGESWSFLVNNLQDLDGGWMNVSLWANLTGSWEYLNSTNTTATSFLSFTGHSV